MAAQGVLLTCFKGCQAVCPQCKLKNTPPISQQAYMGDHGHLGS